MAKMASLYQPKPPLPAGCFGGRKRLPLRSVLVTLTCHMSVAVSPATVSAPGPTVQPAGATLRQIGQAMGLETAPTERLADLPAWSQEEAAAFERTIEEVCEQIEP